MHNTPIYTPAHVPFLRLLLPLVIGIMCHDIPPFILIIFTSIAIIYAISYSKSTISYSYNMAFSIAIAAIMICVGCFSYRNCLPHEELPAINEQTIAIARIDERPIPKYFSLQSQASIIGLNDKDSTRSCNIPIVLHFHDSFTASHLQPGELIAFTPHLQRIASSPIPYEFDYARYMQHKGILYSSSLSDEEWCKLYNTRSSTLYNLAQRIQTYCVTTLKRTGISEENATLLAALLWGDRSNLPDETRQYFSAAGLSHVLAVSGLHTGIIAFILWLVFYPLKYTSLRYSRGILTLILLWIYAFITGLSPSVIRACIMATFVGIASIINRRNTTLNALCGSAVIVLLISPSQLYDIGFQLSYSAVAGIVLLSPYLDISCYTKTSNNLVKYISQLLAVSAAAQIATTPLAAYYFHYIPLWGIISNIILVPLLPLLVMVALILQLFTICNIPHAILATFTNHFAHLITSGANTIASLPAATIDEVWISTPMIIIYIAMIFIAWYMISRRTLRGLIPLLTCLILLQSCHLYQILHKQAPYAILAAQRSTTTMQIADSSNNCYIITTDSTGRIPSWGEELRMHRQATASIVHRQDTLYTHDTYIALPFINYCNNRILWVDNNTWRHTHTTQPFYIDYAIITEQYKGKIESLTHSFEINHIILSDAIYPQRSTQLQNECKKLDISYTDLAKTTFLAIPDSIVFLTSY